MKDHRLVTVLMTLSVPDVADPADAAALLRLAAETTGLDVVHTAGVEGPHACSRHHRPARPPHRPWIVRNLTENTATITDLAGGTLEAPLRSLSPDPLAVLAVAAVVTATAGLISAISATSRRS